MSMGEDFQSIFVKQRENIRAFQNLFEKRLQKEAANPNYFADRNLSVRRAGKKFEMWAPNPKDDNENNIEHTLDCPDRRTNIYGNGWEYKFNESPDELIHRYSRTIFDKSEVVRRAIAEYKGFWRCRVSNLEWASSRGDLFPGSTEKWSRKYPLELNTLEFLVPGLGVQLVEEYESKNIRADIVRELLVINIFSPNERVFESKPADKYDSMRAVVLTILDAVNLYRTECVHPMPVECALCGDILEPTLRQNADYMLPENFCSWCLLVIDYHDENEIVYEGFTDEELKVAMIESFTKLVELSTFPYWKSPVLSKDLMIELNLRERDPEEAKRLAYLFASLPKRTKLKALYETPQHFFHAAGLEDLVPRGKGRGIRSISRCGHLCLSMGEREICEYLHDNSVHHSKEPIYAELVSNGSEFGAMRGDFLVGDIVIEFAGLDGEDAYDAKMELKQTLANKHGLKLIVVRPKDVKNLGAIIPLPFSS